MQYVALLNIKYAKQQFHDQTHQKLMYLTEQFGRNWLFFLGLDCYITEIIEEPFL